MSKDLTQFEKTILQAIQKHCKENEITADKISKLGNNKTVHYSNLDKLTDYIFHEKGWISPPVLGRIFEHAGIEFQIKIKK